MLGAVLGCARGVVVCGMVCVGVLGVGLAVPLWAFLSLWGGGWGMVRGVRVVSDHAHESDDCA